MSSAAQLAANRANAQLSSGPKTIDGKAASSLNAVKTGLTGRTVLLPGEDAALYEQHVHSFLAQYAPLGDQEKNLVQSLTDTEWRLLRIPGLEMGIYALGRIELASKFENLDASVQSSLINAQILVTYQRQLSNLSIQETRLRRQREKDQATLKDLQAKRKEDIRLELVDAVMIDREEKRAGRAFIPAEFGFEFAPGVWEEHLAYLEFRKTGDLCSVARRRAKKAA